LGRKKKLGGGGGGTLHWKRPIPVPQHVRPSAFLPPAAFPPLAPSAERNGTFAFPDGSMQCIYFHYDTYGGLSAPDGVGGNWRLRGCRNGKI